jgi:hypothetical protein
MTALTRLGSAPAQTSNVGSQVFSNDMHEPSTPMT